MKTIKQISEEIGVTKQALQKRISREPLCTNVSPYISTQGSTKYIDESGEALITAVYSMDKPVDKGIDMSIDKGIDSIDKLLSLVSEQHKTIQDLTTANRELTAALEHTTSSLKAAQALHAGTMQTQLLTDKEAPNKKPGLWGRVFKKK